MAPAKAWSGSQPAAGDGGSVRYVMGDAVTRAGSPKPQSPPPLNNASDLRETGYLIAVGSRGARLRKRHREKNLILLLCLLILLLVCFAVTMTVLYARQKRHEVRVCRSMQCLRSAATLALSMDRTADPCQDFHQYVCGKWSEEHPRPDAYRTYDWFREKQAKVYTLVRDFLAANASKPQPRPVTLARTMYAACINTDLLDKLGVGPVLEVLSATGLPIMPTFVTASEEVDYETYSFDWLQAVIDIKTHMGLDVIIGFDMFSDPKNSSTLRLVLGAPEATNPLPNMYRVDKKFRPQRGYLRKSVFKSSIINYDGSSSRRSTTSNEDDEEEKYRNVFILFYAKLVKLLFLEAGEQKFANMTEAEFDQNVLQAASEYYILDYFFYELESQNTTEDDESNYLLPEYTVNEIQAHTDGVVQNNGGTPQPIWKRYLQGVFATSTVQLDFDADKVLVSDPDLEYMALMASYVSKQTPLKLELYIWFKVVEVLAAHTTSDLRSLFVRWRQVQDGINADAGVPPRSVQCASAVTEMLGMSVAYAVLDPHFNKITKPQVQTMLNELKNALSKLVSETKWMDDDTKKATYEKIVQMKSLIGFPDWFNDESKLEDYYAGIEMEDSTHLKNLLNVIQVKLKKTLNKLHDVRNRTWSTDPTEVNAYHAFQENAITIPMVMLQYPFYDLGVDYLNYGSLGAIIGHEITHGFDNFGRQFDKNGNMLPWWTNATVDSFVNMSQCFVDQYSNFLIPELEKNVNGKRTLGENIADNGGLREAFEAYRAHVRAFGRAPALPGFEHMSDEQMFFLAFGNLWCESSTSEYLQKELEDQHTPQRLRARGALQNTPEFARAFRCEPGTIMNPTDRCIIF